MTTPPRPTREEYEQALHRIHARRRAAGDDHHLALSEDPRDVLAYLRRRGRSGLVTDDTGDDIVDALTLRLWLWWEGEAAELWLLEAAEALGRNRRAIGATLGLGSGQGLVDRIARLRAKLGHGGEPAALPVAAAGSWQDLRDAAADLVAHRPYLPEEVRDGLHFGVIEDRLPEWSSGGPPRPAVLIALREVLAELAENGAARPGTPVGGAWARADQLLRQLPSAG